jgi:hypothetical protein
VLRNSAQVSDELILCPSDFAQFPQDLPEHLSEAAYMGVTLFVLNDAPYGVERSYNGLRLGGSLAKRDGEQVWLFLVGDAVACAKAGQKVPEGYYNLG